MEKKLESLKKTLIEGLFRLNNNEWQRVHLTIDFPPFLNKGYKGSQFFYDSSGKLVDLFLIGDQEFQNKIYEFIYDINQEGSYNQIVFSAQRDRLNEAEIRVSFNQTIEDNFQNNLPKSKRGATIPWWRQELN